MPKTMLLLFAAALPLPAQQLSATLVGTGPLCVFAETSNLTARYDMHCSTPLFGAMVLSFSLAPTPFQLPPSLGVGTLLPGTGADLILVDAMWWDAGRLVHEVPVDPSWPPVEWYAQAVLVYGNGLWAFPDVYRFTWG